jgi:hypothetical protein
VNANGDKRGKINELVVVGLPVGFQPPDITTVFDLFD